MGDDDEVAFEHAISFYRAMTVAELAVVPGTAHGLLIEKAALCEAIIPTFCKTKRFNRSRRFGEKRIDINSQFMPPAK